MRPKFCLKRSFVRWIKEVDVTERKYFKQNGNSIFCNACSKRFEWEQKSQLIQHCRTDFHKKSVTLKNNAGQQLPASASGQHSPIPNETVKMTNVCIEMPTSSLEASFTKWIKEIDVIERKHFQIDGNGIFCNACSKRFEWNRKFLIQQHCKTNFHKKSIASKCNDEEELTVSTNIASSQLSPIPNQTEEMMDNVSFEMPKFSLKRSFPRWINQLNVIERKHFQLDGNSIFCKACSKRYKWKRKYHITEHCQTNFHKRKVLKKSAGLQVSTTPSMKHSPSPSTIGEMTDNVCFEDQEQSSSAPNASETEEREADDDFEFTCKTKLCVFCIDVITENYDDDGDHRGSQSSGINAPIVDTFLQGISVVCETLNAANASKFCNRELWSLSGVGENFVRLVCCQKCYRLLDNLVSLQERILATQAALNEGVRKIENYLVKSQRKAVTEDWEFSVNACVLFRDEILKDIPQRYHNHGQKKDKKLMHRSKNSVDFGSKKSEITSPDPIVVAHPTETLELPIPFVKLERLELPNATPHSETLFANDASNDNVFSNVPSAPASDLDFHPTIESDDDFIPTYRRKRKTGRKRGRPRSQTMTDCFKTKIRKRGRPSKIRDYVELPTELQRSKISKPAKLNVLLAETSEDCKRINTKRSVSGDYTDEVNRDSSNQTPTTREEDDDYKPDEEHDSDVNSDEDDEYKPPSRPVLSRKRGLLSAYQLAKKRYQVSAKKTKTFRGILDPKNNPASGRPAQVGSRRYRDIYEDRPPKHRPIYQLDTSQDQAHLMFYNVKFVKTLDILQCLHPNCSHIQHLTGYFADQVALRNFRFHIKHHHRVNYQSDKDMPKKYYYCHNCEDQLENIDDLLEHRRTLHPNTSMPPVLCEVCGDIMPQAEIVEHIISHKSDEEKQFALNQKPGYRGKQKDIMQPSCFPCDECDRVYKCHTELRLHKESHIPIHIRKHLICEFCGGKFTSSTILELHRRRVHLKNLSRPFVCHICNQSFCSNERPRFSAHLRTHTGEKPYVCAQCGKAFNTKWAMGVHEKRHNPNPISIPCEFCSNVYKELPYLRRHQRKHHPDKVERISSAEAAKPNKYVYGPKLMYPCEPCNHVFMYKSMLITHLKGKHNMQLTNKQDYPAMWTYEHHYALDWKTM